MTINTYSFANINGTLIGPGGSIRFGYGAGIDEGGITSEMIGPKTLMKVGADGRPMHSLVASNAARITVRTLKTSPVNKKFADMYNFQKAPSGQNWGQNIIHIQDVARGDVLDATDMAFEKPPTITYNMDAGQAGMEWVFLGILPSMVLGYGIPNVNT